MKIDRSCAPEMEANDDTVLNGREAKLGIGMSMMRIGIIVDIVGNGYPFAST
jgi:hypothetical protein